MARKLRFGVIGVGEFAQVCHLPGLRCHPQAELVAVCGRRLHQARSVAERFGVPHVYTDYRELCARDDIDAVTIATPNSFHAAQALTALHFGKHVLCEKPLAVDLSEAREMAAVAEASGRVHQTAFTFRYGYGLRELRRRVRAGDIGEPYYLRVQYDGWSRLCAERRAGWRDKRELAGGGMLYDLGSHLFDAARFVLGSIATVTGFVQNIRGGGGAGDSEFQTDDIAAAWFQFENGSRGQWFASQATPPFADNGYLEVIGREGALKAALSRGSIDRLKASSPRKPEWEELPLPEAARDQKPHCLEIMMRSFVEACIRGRLDPDLDASFHDGLAAQEAIEAVLQASERVGWVALRGAAGTPAAAS